MSLSSTPPILSVRPSRALVDEAFEVLVENLPPVSPFTLRSLHHSEDGDDWEAYGHYFSDHSGRVSVSEDLSFGGTYSGMEPMGLIWSMRPVPGSRTGLRLRKKDVTTPMLITISLYNGHEDFRDNSPLVSVVTERWYMGPGIQRIEITDGELRGGLFIPPDMDIQYEYWMLLQAQGRSLGFWTCGEAEEGCWSTAPPCWPRAVTSVWLWSTSKRGR